MNTPKLPPLPAPVEALSKWAYDERDMQAYAIAAIQAQGVPDGYALVSKGALQMVINVLRRDAANGMQVLGEIVEQLLASTPPAPQAEQAPAGSGGWEDHAKALERELAYWKQRAQTMHEHQKGECWYWQGDGNDHPESMVNSLPVVIRADALRALMAPQSSVVQQEPLGFISPKQVERIADPEGEFGTYIPMRKTAAGNFTLAVYTHPAQQAKPLSDEQKQRISDETGAGHSLICLVESYINGIKE